MSRTIDSGLLAALTAASCQPYYAVELQFPSGTVRLWTGYGNRTINSQTFIGSGNLLNISGLEEVADLNSVGATVTLSGISSSIISAALQESYQGRPAKIYLGEASVSAVVEVFSGFMDVMTINHDADRVSVPLTIESKMVVLQRAKIRRYTDENQKLRYPSDTFFSFVSAIQDVQVPWGRKAD